MASDGDNARKKEACFLKFGLAVAKGFV